MVLELRRGSAIPERDLHDRVQTEHNGHYFYYNFARKRKTASTSLLKGGFSDSQVFGELCDADFSRRIGVHTRCAIGSGRTPDQVLSGNNTILGRCTQSGTGKSPCLLCRSMSFLMRQSVSRSWSDRYPSRSRRIRSGSGSPQPVGWRNS